MYTYTGTIAYTAPEVFRIGEYDQKVDMWSLGVVLYTMLIGHEPFRAEFVKDLIEKIKNEEFTFDDNELISEEAKDLITNLLSKNPKERMSAD